MFFKSLAVVCLLFIAVQGDYTRVFTKIGRDCIKEINTDESTIRTKMTETGITKVDDEIMEKFFECCMRTHITDTNEITIDDKFKTYMTDVITHRLDGRKTLATIITDKCMEHCKDTKDTTKGKTAIKMFTCMMKCCNDTVKKDTE